MQEKLDEFDFRIIVTDAAFFKHEEKIFKNFEYQNISLIGDDNTRLQVVDASVRDNAYLFVRESDVFISTAWWTAELAKSIAKFQMTNFGSKNRSIYLIQDYEPGFYPWSSNWVLANNTYKDGDDVIAIFNSEELCKFFEDYNFGSKFILQYSPNAKIKNNLLLKERKKTILFYGRPSVSRNCFEILIDSIYKWQINNPTESICWNVVSIGEEYPISRVSHINNIKVVGKVALHEYALYLSEASIGISLMISPHPSYPPLEMAMAGMLVITNDFANKNLSLRSKNIISVSYINDDEISEALQAAVLRVEDDYKFDCQDVENIKSYQQVQIYEAIKIINLIQQKT